MDELKTPDQWIEELKINSTIIDCDGWRDGTPWSKPITKGEFWVRFNQCTIRQKPDEKSESPDVDKSLDLDKSPDVDEEVPDFDEGASELDTKEEGCPTCGNTDIQTAELLTAWKEIERLERQLEAAKHVVLPPDGTTGEMVKLTQKAAIDAIIPGSTTDWKFRYEKIKAAYIRTRLEVSGSFGNWDYATRKRVLEHEISTELGFTV